jgi:hypothetical protein
MPWKAQKAKGGGYDIVRADTGKKVGHSATKAEAEASVRARYANSPEAKKMPMGKTHKGMPMRKGK